MNEKLAPMKNFVARNKTKILVTTAVVTTTAAVLMKVAVNQHDQFLKDKGLYEEYYAAEED